MSRDEILRQIRRGRPMVVGGGGSTIRPAGKPVSDGARVKSHDWGN